MFNVKNISLAALQTFYQNFEGDKTFLQSAPYVAYRRQCGETITIEGYFKNENLVAVAVIQNLQTRIKRWLHVPHGPLVQAADTKDFWSWWLNHYAQMGKGLKKDLVRVSPLIGVDFPLVKEGLGEIFDAKKNPSYSPFNKREIQSMFNKAGYKPAAIHLVNPEKTWGLDITQSEDELLGNMKKSTRYEVRKSLKPETGFSITIDQDLDTFWKLHEATVSRQKFVPFTRQSTAAEIEAFGNDCQIITVWHENQALASGVFLFDNNAGYYHQGASVYSKLPAAHAYIWAAICEAKKRGCTEFNFWGVCGEEEKNHPWYGLSKFKRGFGGAEKNYHHVQDFEITWRAQFNRMIEAKRRKKRGY